MFLCERLLSALHLMFWPALGLPWPLGRLGPLVISGWRPYRGVYSDGVNCSHPMTLAWVMTKRLSRRRSCARRWLQCRRYWWALTARGLMVWGAVTRSYPHACGSRVVGGGIGSPLTWWSCVPCIHVNLSTQKIPFDVSRGVEVLRAGPRVREGRMLARRRGRAYKPPGFGSVPRVARLVADPYTLTPSLEGIWCPSRNETQ